MKKDKWIHIKCTEEERTKMKQKAEAAGMPLSELVRRSLERTNTWTVHDRNAVYSVSKELARIGNNLNQLARWANTEKSGLDAVQVISSLGQLEEELEAIKEGIADAH